MNAMLEHVTIENFRTFKHLTVSNLGRVNLLVGTNNSGKTSALEAIEWLEAARLAEGSGTFGPLIQSLLRRDRVLFGDRGGRTLSISGLATLFHGYAVAEGRPAKLEGHYHDGGRRRIALSVQPRRTARTRDTSADQLPMVYEERPAGIDQDVVPELVLDSAAPGHPAQLSSQSYLSELLRMPPRLWDEGRSTPTLVFVSTASLSSNDIVRMFEDVVLTEYESLLLDALRIIEPNVERLASLGTHSVREGTRDGIVVNIKGMPPRLPISSMGDGMWRLLGLTLALVRARGGVLLVDEIDTGLHHTVMERMWRLVIESAEQLGTQVFATTHSSDCWISLARVIEQRRDAGDSTSASIQRIERDRRRAVSFSDEEIVIAAERQLEVR